MVCAVVALPSSINAEDKDRPLNDNEFVMKAAICGMHEVELGQIAQANASSPDVKKFGERMVIDHKKAHEELKTVAAKASIPVPDKVTADKQKEADNFRNLKGNEFDRAFMAHQVKEHEKAIEMLTKASKDLKNPGLKEFVEKTLPAIKEHHKIAKKINDELPKQ
jgi:putative membrane protein